MNASWKLFLHKMGDVWHYSVFGIDLGRWIIAVGIVIASLVLRNALAHFVVNRLRPFTEKTETKWDDAVLNAIERPLQLAPVILGVIVVKQYLGVSGIWEVFLLKSIQSVVVLAIFWTLYNLVNPLSVLFDRLSHLFSLSMIYWLVNALRAGLIFMGSATVLGIWGIQIGHIIAGLGLFGVAVALGAQDLFKNLISGILILAERRFQIGDWIRVEGVVEGTVETIGFRSTRIRQFDKAPVFVPNADLSDNSVINFSQMTYRRISWVIGLEYRTTVAQLRTIRSEVEAWLMTHEAFIHPPVAPLFVRISDFSDSSIDMMVYCFTRTTVWGEWLKLKEDLACAIKEIVERNNTGFAFPSQSIYMETLPDGAPSMAENCTQRG